MDLFLVTVFFTTFISLSALLALAGYLLFWLQKAGS